MHVHFFLSPPDTSVSPFLLPDTAWKTTYPAFKSHNPFRSCQVGRIPVSSERIDDGVPPPPYTPPFISQCEPVDMQSTLNESHFPSSWHYELLGEWWSIAILIYKIYIGPSWPILRIAAKRFGQNQRYASRITVQMLRFFLPSAILPCELEWQFERGELGC
jgi:hypothetical protein